MEIIIGFLLIGWIFNLCKECIDLWFQSIKDRDWFGVIFPPTIIILVIFLTWLLYHFGIYTDKLIEPVTH